MSGKEAVGLEGGCRMTYEEMTYLVLRLVELTRLPISFETGPHINGDFDLSLKGLSVKPSCSKL